MSTITTRDGTNIFYKDWGTGQPIVFSHGWPLSSDAWDRQMLFFGSRGYRVVAHDRRSHGRSDQTWNGNNMDQYADDLAELIEKLDLRDIVIIGHSTFSIPFSIWMLVSYFNAIPRDLDEAATIDGASRLQTIRLVVLPLVMPGIVTTAIYVFITSWNEYLFAMMLSGETVRPVTVALQLFIGEFTVQWGILTAGGTIIALPVTILFLFVQKRLVGGLTAGAVKS